MLKRNLEGIHDAQQPIKKRLFNQNTSINMFPNAQRANQSAAKSAPALSFNNQKVQNTQAFQMGTKSSQQNGLKTQLTNLKQNPIQIIKETRVRKALKPKRPCPDQKPPSALKSTRGQNKVQAISNQKIFQDQSLIVQKSAAQEFNLQCSKENSFSRSNLSFESQSPNYQFKAKPMPNFENPFKPFPLNQQLTTPIDFVLNSERRAQQRVEQFQQIMKVKEEKLQLQEMIAKQQKDAEELQLQKIRELTIFHASPVRQYKNIEISRSQKELTIPQAPLLRTQLRAQQNIEQINEVKQIQPKKYQQDRIRTNDQEMDNEDGVFASMKIEQYFNNFYDYQAYYPNVQQ